MLFRGMLPGIMRNGPGYGRQVVLQGTHGLMNHVARRHLTALFLSAAAMVLGACGGGGLETVEDRNTYSSSRARGKGQTLVKKDESGIFGNDGITLFGGGGDKADNSGGGGGGVGVNSYLSRASLDTISCMPLASADPFGGVIITEWFSPPETPAERFKVNVFILGRDLRADGVRAAVFKQTRDPGGNWLDAPVEAQTATDLENSILSRARQLRVSTAQK